MKCEIICISFDAALNSVSTLLVKVLRITTFLLFKYRIKVNSVKILGT
jgi:hypothetical protein